MNIKTPKILFFIDGPVPTDENRLDAFDLGVAVQFRNAQHVSRIEEECDGVAGAVPEAYKDHPTAEDALKAYKAEAKKLRANLAAVGGKAPQTGNQSGKDENKGGQQGAKTGQGDANGGSGTPTPGQGDDDAAKAAAAAAAGTAGEGNKGTPAAGAAGAAGGWKQN